MTMKIEVYPDTSHPGGGHAIIRLRGVALLPPGATFRIVPIDEAMADIRGWPQGDLKPLETRQTPEGIELRIGPDIVDAPRLEPGTPVTISVPDGHLSAELVWPDIPVSSSQATGSVVMTPSQMAAELAATERARMDAARAADAAAQAAAERIARQARIDAEQAKLTAQASEAARQTALEQQ